MSLETPIRIRMLQRKLYQKAKEEPSYRFYLLYDKMYREDVLAHAYALVRSNQGAPGVDGQSFWGIESQGLEEWLSGVREDLRAKTYQPQAVRRVMIPKPGGGERPLGIPTIRDRVVQTAAKLLLEPIFEADFDPNAYGYRPKRSAQGAIQKVHKLLCEGYADVVDADLSKYGERKKIRSFQWGDGPGPVWWLPSGRILGLGDTVQPGSKARVWQMNEDGTHFRRI